MNLNFTFEKDDLSIDAQVEKVEQEIPTELSESETGIDAEFTQLNQKISTDFSEKIIVIGKETENPITIKVKQVNEGVRITVTDKSGTQSEIIQNGKDGIDGLPGKDGQNGQPGKDGTSPVVSISAIEGGHRISITDTEGKKSVDVMNGSDGKNGSNGQDGNGIKSAILNDDYTLTLTFDDGTTYTTPSIRGAMGEPGIPGQQGIQGIPGEPGQDGKDGQNGQPGADGLPGKDGQDGVDGITPHIGDNGNWFIGDTDTGKPSRGNDGLPGKDGSDGSPGKDGQSGQDGKNGADGYTPQRGKDYWTDTDKNAIVSEVIASMGEPSKVTSYTRPTSIKLKSGMQFLCYAGGNGGTFTFTIGGKDFKCTTKSTNECCWFIWVQTTETAGSVISPGGTRTYLNPIEKFDDVPVSYDGSGSYIVITIG